MTSHRAEAAIVGMAGRFPGAPDIEAFWSNIANRVESIVRFSAQDLAGCGVDPAILENADYVPAGAPLADAECFDAAFFGINPAEARLIDPQQRILLECAWAALEDAGIDPASYEGKIGVFAGVARNTYLMHLLNSRPDVLEAAGEYQSMIASEKDFPATRIAYKLNLRGPAVNVQTACSTSGVALHLACQSLRAGDCDVALVAGGRVLVPTRSGYRYEEGGIMSPDGHCRAFDAGARGTVRGSGAGVIVLRRLDDAIRDRDNVRAVIKGSAINNDGAAKVGFTAPSLTGQAAAVADALAAAGISADSIGYVEAHGTGTAIGDPIEIAALTRAFRRTTRRNGYCAVSSVKANIGHLDAGAAIAGIIKVVHALQRRQLPPSPNFEHPNPEIDFKRSPFYVPTALSEWTAEGPRRAGVSSFGLGGTNAHIVLEEAPAIEETTSARKRHLLLLSARSRDRLDEAAARLGKHFAARENVNLADVAYTLQTGRRAFAHRRALVCRDRNEGIQLLAQPDPKRVFDGDAERPVKSVAFLFPGQGAQYVNMGRALYESEARFRKEIDECAAVLKPQLGLDLRTILYPGEDGLSVAQQQIMQTAITQPALFVVEYALARLWLSWGVQPSAMIGHSLGEYVAACLAGVFARDDALRLVARRGRMMQDLPSGAMLAVRSSLDTIAADLTPRTSVAALNAPNVTVIAGDHEAIAALEARLAARDIEFRRLPTSHAFHSSMMEPIVDEFAAFVSTVSRANPSQRWIAGLTGEAITDTEATDPRYWATQMRHTVRYMAGVGKLMDPSLALLEVGPGQALTNFARQHPARKSNQLMANALHGAQDPDADLDALYAAAGRLWTVGIGIDWHAFNDDAPRRKVSLPTYPFERCRHWVEPAAVRVESQTAPIASAPSQTVPAEEAMPDTISIAPRPAPDHGAHIVKRLQALFAELSGIDAAALEPSATFLDLGLDSLFLTQASNALHKQFGVKVSMRELLDDCSTLQALAARIAPSLPAEPAPQPAAPARLSGAVTHQALPAPEAMRQPVAPDANTLEHVLAQQLELMSRQLDMLRSAGLLGTAPTQPGRHEPRVDAPPAHPGRTAQPPAATTLPPAERTSVAFGPYRPPSKGQGSSLAPMQEQHLRAFIDQYVARTRGSKRFTADHRAHLADPRSVAGFRSMWKEMVYPIVVNRSSGARLWDVDGNEYIDLANGFGTILFGHNPDFVREAIKAQLEQGIETGPQTPLAGEVARLVCDMTGMERAAFCSTGSEAVTAAIRVARTVTGRDKIVLFAGSYHGIFDEVLVRPTAVNGVRRSIPIAPGIAPNMVENVVVLDYGSPASLQTIKSMGGELAAVLVEPVQSRHPDNQPRDFLLELRKITAEFETALVFDEVVTGFRTHPGGAQALFGVRADIATYGKVIGGGLPIGVVAGRAKYLDALDGGAWRYGDQSAPEVGVTFFAGTFVRHPLALCVARAVLLRLQNESPDLQRTLNLRVTRFADALNAHAEKVRAPVRITHFASWLCVNLPNDLPLASLFFSYMRAKGIHILEGRPVFLTLAHTDADLERVTSAFHETLAEMQAAGFLPGGEEQPPVPGARKGRDASGRSAWFVPDPARAGKYLQIRETAETRH
ncbi:MAG TPA: aminotransferase class III-fold pyridoxal phosphate-dependent enzyme [Burkholderiales bacterium]|nr:aminotransferase class III-fold pyridoxal phosphate-dependent enzyme [Burkholderiales bacterium]